MNLLVGSALLFLVSSNLVFTIIFIAVFSSSRTKSEFIIPIFLMLRVIQRILKYPPTRTLSGEEKQLLWKFRFSLMSEKKALTKFLRCVEWSDVQVRTLEFLAFCYSNFPSLDCYLLL